MSTDPAALLDANRRRLRIRRILLIASTPVLLVALAFCGKVLSMYAFAYQAMASYAAADYPGTVMAARGQGWLNFAERYKAPYNLGVGLADAGRLDEARAAFEEALGLAQGLEQCAVRVNLSIVWERIGDLASASGDPAAAQAAWQQALVVSQESPEECRSPEADEVSPDPDRTLDEELDEQQQRLEDKLEQQARPDEQQQEDDPQPQPDDSALDEIERRLQNGAEERDAHESDQGSGDPGGADRPW